MCAGNVSKSVHAVSQACVHNHEHVDVRTERAGPAARLLQFTGGRKQSHRASNSMCAAHGRSCGQAGQWSIARCASCHTAMLVHECTTEQVSAKESFRGRSCLQLTQSWRLCCHVYCKADRCIPTQPQQNLSHQIYSLHGSTEQCSGLV